MNLQGNYKPLEDRVLIRPIAKKELDKTDSGIIIPDSVKKQVNEGEVVSIGVGRFASENGQHIPTTLFPGDKVLYGSQQGVPIEVNKETLLVMREGDVLLLISRDDKREAE